MDFFILKLCWKNIWRNKRRTFLAVNAIAIGSTWLIWAHNYLDALNKQFVENAIRYQNGHIMVSQKGFHEYKVTKKFIPNPTALTSWLENSDEVKAYSPKVVTQGLLSSARGSANIWYAGIDPKMDKHTTQFHANMVEGTYFESKKRGKPMLIGVGLEKKLGVRLGSKLVALTQGVDGSIGNELFYVAGIFETHSEYDKALAFVRIEDARLLMSLPEKGVHQVSILLKDPSKVDAFQSKLMDQFGDRSFEILTWKQVQQHLMASIEIYNAANKLFMFIILFIASVGIANSILMGIMERTREFGVMMAIGTSKGEMIRMAILETLLLTAVGILVGNVMGVGVTLYFQYAGFDLAWFTSNEIRMNGALVQTISYPTVQWLHNIVITATILVLSILSALLPIQHISKLKATVALKAN